MCGIVAYLGKSEAKSILIEGLKRLEYRGYDSAGFALVDSDARDFVISRAVGQVSNLENASLELGLGLKLGIAHTRWATHGAPSEINAHPHRAGAVVLVHNGIIENHSVLKEELKSSGIKFSSQTDTEVFAQLIEFYRLEELKTQFKNQTFETLDLKSKEKIVLAALLKASKRVHGHFAILFLVQGIPGTVFGVQSGAPLALAFQDGNTFLASDLQALIQHSRKICFIPQGSYFVAQQGEAKLFDLKTGAPLILQFEEIHWNADQVEKDGFDHFMLKEIYQQPSVIADTLSGRLPSNAKVAFLWDEQKAFDDFWKNCQRLHLVSCGTAYHAALVAKYFFEKWARLPVEVDLASEYRYRTPVFEKSTCLGVISQSGETADTLSCLRMANQLKVPTFSVCNVPGSSISRESLLRYPTKAGPEIGVASTKAFTTQLTVLISLALDVARIRGHYDPEMDQMISGMARLPHDFERALKDATAIMKTGATLKDKKTILFVGRGTMFPIALEGALKLKEITYRHAEGYAAGELKHGPIALVDENLCAVVLAPKDELFLKTASNLEEIKSRGGIIIGVGEEGHEEFSKLCHLYIGLPKIHSWLAPILYVLPLQLLSYGLAKELGVNIDKPRNLAKSVTVE